MPQWHGARLELTTFLTMVGVENGERRYSPRDLNPRSLLSGGFSFGPDRHKWNLGQSCELPLLDGLLSPRRNPSLDMTVSLSPGTPLFRGFLLATSQLAALTVGSANGLAIALYAAICT